MLGLIIFLLFPLGIGFAAGYGTRAWISRRRRAVAREEYYKKHPEKRESLA
jgi:hypothetical protein